MQHNDKHFRLNYVVSPRDKVQKVNAVHIYIGVYIGAAPPPAGVVLAGIRHPAGYRNLPTGKGGGLRIEKDLERKNARLTAPVVWVYPTVAPTTSALERGGRCTLGKK